MKNLLKCPICNEENVKCDFFTVMQFKKNNINICDTGVELISEDEKDREVPTMFMNEFCVAMGYYGMLNPEEQGQIFSYYANLRCEKCGELKGYKVHRDENNVCSIVLDEITMHPKNKDKRSEKNV